MKTLKTWAFGLRGALGGGMASVGWFEVDGGHW